MNEIIDLEARKLSDLELLATLDDTRLVLAECFGDDERAAETALLQRFMRERDRRRVGG
jgi:hypothetical protein